VCGGPVLLTRAVPVVTTGLPQRDQHFLAVEIRAICSDAKSGGLFCNERKLCRLLPPPRQRA
jgi:hypothetical protein